ncbi:uncharacterized protein IWZ02DRAFT_18485 [Phyllosticta citriasiana]|uniref:uncharacterized protein n=1 Tax=Phyllosticta citriasiana TaxID=595635 RepID=UPI0030FD4C27
MSGRITLTFLRLAHVCATSRKGSLRLCKNCRAASHLHLPTYRARGAPQRDTKSAIWRLCGKQSTIDQLIPNRLAACHGHRTCHFNKWISSMEKVTKTRIPPQTPDCSVEHALFLPPLSLPSDACKQASKQTHRGSQVSRLQRTTRRKPPNRQKLGRTGQDSVTHDRTVTFDTQTRGAIITDR